MSLLLKYALPAERRRGCVWADKFESEVLVGKNGAAVTGAPTFAYGDDGGVTLDGTSDYLTYNLTGTEFNSAEISIVCEFTPDFSSTEAVARYFFEANNGAAGSRVILYKNTPGLTLDIYLGNTTLIAQIPHATWGPYWLQNQRNVIVISGTSGATNCWLNGQQILTADPSVWAAQPDVSEISVGVWPGGPDYYLDGTIHSLQIYHCLLTAQEAIDIYERTTYDYTRPRGPTWEDKFVSQAAVENHFGVVTGSPTFSGDGVVLDGSADYLTYGLRGDEFNHSSISIAVEFTPDFNWNENVYRYILDADDGAGNNRYLVHMSVNGDSDTMVVWLGGTTIASIPSATYSPYWLQNQRNVLVIAGDAINDLTNAWLNGTQILTNDNSPWTQQSDITRLIVGDYATSGLRFDGTIHRLQVYPFLVTATEAAAMYDNRDFDVTRPGSYEYQMRMEDHLSPDSVELLTNGTFDTDISSWTDSSTMGEVVSWQAGRLNCLSSGAGWASVDQEITTVASTEYIIEADFYGNGDWAVIKAGTVQGSNDLAGITYNMVQGHYELRFTAAGVSTWIRLGSGGGECEYDNVSVKGLIGTADSSGNNANLTLVHAPVKQSKHGYDFDGSNDYMTIASAGMLNSSGISFVMEFEPDFDYDVNTLMHLFDSTTSKEYYVQKRDNASSNVLRVVLSSVQIADIASATYAPHWRQNRRNVLIVSGDAENDLTNVWLNGYQILTDDATAWTQADPADFYLGARNDAVVFFDGKISHFSIYPFVLTDIQRLDIEARLQAQRNSV